MSHGGELVGLVFCCADHFVRSLRFSLAFFGFMLRNERRDDDLRLAV